MLANGARPRSSTTLFPTASRSPRAYRNPRRKRSSSSGPARSSVHSQSLRATSIGRTRTPRRCASFTSVAGL